jgi:hypothetical protein
MSRGAAKFTQSDVARAVRGARAAGVDVGRVEINPDGTIAIVAADKPDAVEKVQAPREIVL